MSLDPAVVVAGAILSLLSDTFFYVAVGVAAVAVASAAAVKAFESITKP